MFGKTFSVDGVGIPWRFDMPGGIFLCRPINV